MLVCIGCGGRNLPELDVCGFCHRRLGSQQANDSRARRIRLASIALAILVLALLVSGVLLVLARS
jgi:hypothetical protein